MAERYVNRDDLSRRLNSTICMYKGHPYYVSLGHGSRGDQVDLFDLYNLNKNPLRIDHTDPEFVDRSVSLGFLNWQNDCYYLSRIPMRHNVQAVYAAAIRANPGIGHNQWFMSPEFGDTILNKYPSYEHAMDSIDSGINRGCAFNRYLAVARRPAVRQLGLYYKNRLLALYDGRWDYLKGKDIMHLKKLAEKAGVSP